MTVKSYVAFLLLICPCIASVLRRDPRNEFHNHVVVKPTLYQAFSVRKDPLSLKDVTEEDVKLQFKAFGKHFEVDLKENEYLFTPNYREILDYGEKEVIYELGERERRCYYQGRLPNIEDSWAAVSICDGISGVISDGKETYYIEPDRSLGNEKHLVFKASDHKQKGFKCGVEDDLLTMYDRHLNELKMENLEDPYKSDNDSRYIEVVVVNDNSMYRKYNSNSTAVLDRTKQIINVANALLSRLNTFLALKTVRVWMVQDAIDISVDSTRTLNNFLKFRKDTLIPNDPNDNAVLLTNVRYDAGVAGNAYRGYICTDEKSGESVVDVSDVVGIVGASTAHELGHNLGSYHDATACNCEDSFCVMHPYVLPSMPTHWSSCSKSDIKQTYSSGKDSCLKNKPTVVKGPSCGNGYLEDGEECDCSIKEMCDDACCDATTCRKTC